MTLELTHEEGYCRLAFYDEDGELAAMVVSKAQDLLYVIKLGGKTHNALPTKDNPYPSIHLN